MRATAVILSLAVVLSVFSGCMRRFGPEPETVPWVELSRYEGLWHEIASNPAFFNRNLVAVTAEYEAIGDGAVSVLNTGYVGTPDGRKRTITGTATVVTPETNSKLEVRFDPFPACLFAGSYWIVLLDDEANEQPDQPYQYAVVTDNRQSTMFVLAREPELPESIYNTIKETLEARNIDTSRLRITGTLTAS